ncbi:MAG TPA: hypothetical protein PLC42_05910, partial [Parachlamydiaceae bacterium]|nr:hypothetical protein [Parachlamydiaceae bacterium]
MRFLFLIVFSLFLVCKAPAELAILPYLTSENDALSLVDGTVDAYNGKLVQKDVDIHILGSSPLELNRYYDGGHHYPGELGYGVGLSPPLLLTFQPDLKKQNVLLEQRSGSQIPCTVKKISKSVFYTGSVDPDFFKSGYTNCCEALLNGEPSLLSLHIEGTNHQFVVMLGDGTKRIYRFFNALNFNEFYRLVKEELPNGTERHYAYKNNHQLLLERIWTTASNGSLILNSVTFTYGNNRTALTASNGQYVCYEQRLKSGKAKRTSGLSSSSVRFSESVLAKVSSNYLPECHYEVLSRSHFTDTLFSFKEIKKADNRFVRADYDHQERVKHLWKSGIDVPAYTFEYHFGYTKVLDANKRSKRFEYDKRRLSKIVEEECAHHFKWNHKGQLVKQILTDGHGNSVIKREYQYDAKGNITEAKISGTILAKASQDCYVTTYSYGERNLLLSENHNQKQEIIYCYVPNTNLVEKKLTFADGQFVEREFYQYDQNSILIQKIIDDGSTSEKEDLTNVSYRLITDIEPQLNPNLPGMTFPRLIKESYLDLKTGEKKLLKIIENIYCYGDLLSEEK